jgi:hypothetical protein
MTQLTTTLNRIRAHGPCHDGWTKLLAGLGKTRADDEPLPFATILRISGLNDALWCARVEPQHSREWRLFAVWCARRVQHLMTDPRSIAVLDVAERHAHGMATDEELRAARADAWAAAEDAARAARAAAQAAWDAAWAVWAAAEASARAAAWDAARAAEWAALAAAWDGAWAAAGAAAGGTRDAAWNAERAAQTAEFLRIAGGE